MKKTNEVTKTQEMIKIERRYGNHSSYFVDANGLLKGEWGGFDCVGYGPNGEAMFEIFYTHFGRRIPINEFGLFYNKFSCKKYDGIVKLPVCDFYICEKNGRFGLIDSDERCVLHTAYNEVTPCFWGNISNGMRPHRLFVMNDLQCWEDKYKDTIFFIVTTETGKFLFNLSKRSESSVYDDIFFASDDYHAQIIYKSGDKYGAIDIEGNVLLKPYFDTYGPIRSLYYSYNKSFFNVWVEKGLFYGRIPVNEYDICFKVGHESAFGGGLYFVFMKNGKYGLLSNILLRVVSGPNLDEIIIYKPKDKQTNGCLHIDISYVNKSHRNIYATYVITREGDNYKLYNVENGHLIIDGCKKMIYQSSGGRYDVVEFSKDDIMGYVLWNESIVSTAEYEKVCINSGFIFVQKDGKCGVIMLSGDELFPCIYDRISVSSCGVFTMIKEGKEEKYKINSKNRSSFSNSYESPTYGRYAGSYAQSEMDWSDDDIDTVLDGDPSAYWNVD